VSSLPQLHPLLRLLGVKSSSLPELATRLLALYASPAAASLTLPQHTRHLAFLAESLPLLEQAGEQAQPLDLTRMHVATVAAGTTSSSSSAAAAAQQHANRPVQLLPAGEALLPLAEAAGCSSAECAMLQRDLELSGLVSFVHPQVRPC
jgi:hypothetical protein